MTIIRNRWIILSNSWILLCFLQRLCEVAASLVSGNEYEYNILNYGADPTGINISNDAIETAIQLAIQNNNIQSQKNSTESNVISNGFPIVIIPKGIFRIRPPIQLFSNMTLDIQDGGQIITGSISSSSSSTLSNNNNNNINDEIAYILRQTTPTNTSNNHTNRIWPLTPSLITFGGGRDDGLPYRYESIIYATNVTNLNIIGSGSGMINGNGPLWWSLRNKRQIQYTRPHLIEIRHSSNIIIDGIQLINSPFWTLHLYNSNNIQIQNIYINTPLSVKYNNTIISSTNVDGIDINSCKNVFVQHCTIYTQDDAIAIKSGLDIAGIRSNISSHNIYVNNITIQTDQGGGLAIGSEVSGNIYNVTFNNINIYKAKRGIRIKTARGRGGIISDIKFHNIQILNLTKSSDAAIQITMFGGGNRPSLYTGYRIRDVSIFHNIEFYNISLDIDAIYNRGIKILGDIAFSQSIPIRINNITFSNITMIDENTIKDIDNTTTSSIRSSIRTTSSIIHKPNILWKCSNALNVQFYNESIKCDLTYFIKYLWNEFMDLL